MGLSNVVMLRCPNRKVQVLQYSSFMATTRTPAQQQHFIDSQSALSSDCCVAMHAFLKGVRPRYQLLPGLL